MGAPSAMPSGAVRTGTEYLIFDDDLVGGFLGNVRAGRGDRGYGVSLVQSLVVGEDVIAEVSKVRGALSERDDLVGHFREVRAGDDGVDAVQRLCLTRVNGTGFGREREDCGTNLA